MRLQRGALICVLLSLVGLGICAYLEYIHLGLLRGEFVGGAACGTAGTAFNCHIVTSSPIGTLLGLPLAIWGLIGYLAALSLALIAWQFPDLARQTLAGLVMLSLAFVLVDVGLFVIMVTRIKFLCPLCLGTYAVNLLLGIVSTLALRLRWGAVAREIPALLAALRPARGAATGWVFSGIVLTGALGAVATHRTARYVLEGNAAQLRKQMAQFVSRQPRVTVDTAGDPVEGNPGGELQIVEFSDFMCPSCQKASKFNPLILAGRGHEAALIFKHFPLDQECHSGMPRTVHQGACRVAAATECALEQGNQYFWKLHDRIFQGEPPYKVSNLDADAAATGLNPTVFQDCMASGRGMEAVKKDVAEGIRLKVTSTPTYIINGVPTTGILTPSMFDEFVNALRHPAPAEGPAQPSGQPHSHPH